MNESDVETKFATVFALIAASKSLPPDAKPLKSYERRQAWDAFMTTLPTILSNCSGIDLHPDCGDYPDPLRLWDFLNGREILVTSN